MYISNFAFFKINSSLEILEKDENQDIHSLLLGLALFR